MRGIFTIKMVLIGGKLNYEIFTDESRRNGEFGTTEKFD